MDRPMRTDMLDTAAAERFTARLKAVLLIAGVMSAWYGVEILIDVLAALIDPVQRAEAAEYRRGHGWRAADEDVAVGDVGHHGEEVPRVERLVRWSAGSATTGQEVQLRTA